MKLTKKLHLILISIAIIAFFTRCGYIYFYAKKGIFSKFATISEDEIDYNTLALNIIHKKAFINSYGEITALRPPLYPLFIAFIYKLTGDNNYFAVYIVQALLSSISIYIFGLLVFLIFRSFFVSFVACVLKTFYPPFIFFVGELLTESLFCFFVICLYCLMLFFLQKPSLLKSFFIGTIIGLATLTRPTGLFFLPATLAYLFIFSKRKLLTLVVFLIGLSFMLMPWSLRNYYHFGRFTLSTKGGYELAFGISKDYLSSLNLQQYALIDKVAILKKGEAEGGFELMSLSIKRIIEEPLTFLKLYFLKGLHFLSPFLKGSHDFFNKFLMIITYTPILIGTLIWCLLLKKYSDWIRLCALYLLINIFIFWSLHNFFTANIRYRIPVIDPVFIIFFSHLIISFIKTIRVV